jgi:hypothetical protein
MENENIIIVYGPPWDQAAKLSKHHFARLWSKKNRVLYIESPINSLSFFTRFKEAISLWKRYKNGCNPVSDNLWVTTFFYLLPFRGSKYFFGSEYINRFNQYLVKKKIKSLISKLKFDNPILVVASAHIDPIINEFNFKKIIYHCSDDYTIIPSFPEDFPKVEESLITKCDLVVTTADELMKAKRRLNKNTISIPNGANVEHFSSTQNSGTVISNEMSIFKKPIIGYVGSIFQWLNTSWISFAAEKCPEYDFVFIGPLQIDITKFKKYKNIHFLGPKPYSVLPSYIKAFKVAVIPFTIDGVTLKASPIKFYEYLSSGIPIVSTELPDLLPFKDDVYLVKEKEEYVGCIESAINNDSKARINRRMKIAKEYSWESRFKTLNNHINNI